MQLWLSYEPLRDDMQGVPNFGWLRRSGIVLILLFGYLAIAFVAFEQGRTIDSQRELIHQLYQDSLELSAVRMQQQAQHAHPTRVR